VRSGCFGSDTALVRGLEASGFTHVRRFSRMRIDLSSAELPERTPALPDGVTLVTVHSDAERRRLHAVQQASFADHWNHVERSFEEFVEQAEARGSQDPDGWWLLEVDGVPAAVCIVDESRVDLDDGYVSTLGVAREFRGRGLAVLLLTRALVYYRDLGRSGVQLSVDSDSPTGANHLYEKVGMQTSREIHAWAHAL
jgi:ribosomal protein S18 acetylase RimI-like enzyme